MLTYRRKSYEIFGIISDVKMATVSDVCLGDRLSAVKGVRRFNSAFLISRGEIGLTLGDD